MRTRPPLGWEPWQPGRRASLPGLAPVIGHRGAAAHAPENTLAAFRAAHALGAGWVEFDVKLTRDDVPILMHDDLLDRTTDGRGPVALQDHAAVARLDAGRLLPGFDGEPVPSLAQAVSLLLELGLGANVELKPCRGSETKTAAVVAMALAHSWPQDGPPILVSSFSVMALRATRAVAPGLPLGLLVEQVPLGWADLVQELGCTTLHPWHLPIRSGAVRRLADAGLPLLLYTVNDPARAAKLFAAGARAIITDAPDRILPVVPSAR